MYVLRNKFKYGAFTGLCIYPKLHSKGMLPINSKATFFIIGKQNFYH